MKIPFLQSNKPNWSKLQVELSDAIMKYLAGGKDFEVPKSFALLTKEEGVELLNKVQEEFVINRGWHEMVLLPEEERAFNEYFKIKE
jgi:hypothetical protein